MRFTALIGGDALVIDKGLTLDITVSFVDLAGRERQLALRKRLEPFDIEEISPGGGGYLDALERERESECCASLTAGQVS